MPADEWISAAIMEPIAFSRCRQLIRDDIGTNSGLKAEMIK